MLKKKKDKDTKQKIKKEKPVKVSLAEFGEFIARIVRVKPLPKGK